jgi:hypothetical protein
MFEIYRDRQLSSHEMPIYDPNLHILIYLVWRPNVIQRVPYTHIILPRARIK